MVAITDVLPRNYGYVVLVALGTCFLNIYLSIKVVGGRKKYDVQYPLLYTDDKAKQDFNCIQRVHQNFMETWAQVLMLLFISGLQYPTFTAAAGCLQIVGRIVYAWGYYTGEPKKRQPGSMMMLVSTFALLGGAISFGLHLLRWL